MSSFLVNLARRGAGLRVIPIQAPVPSPFPPEIRKQEQGLEDVQWSTQSVEVATDNAATDAPLRASELVEAVAMPSEGQDTPSIQRVTGTQPTLAEPAVAIGTPSLTPQRYVIPDAGRAEVPTPSLGRLEPTMQVSLNDREVTAQANDERTPRVALPAAKALELQCDPSTQASLEVPGPTMIVRAPRTVQVVLPAEPSAGPLRATARETREQALLVSAIRPALAESNTFLIQLPKAKPAFSEAPAQLPIHVRIGRVEVRAPTAPTPTPAKPNPPASLGFDSYYRVRNYRS
jgi:hypothetical protein